MKVIKTMGIDLAKNVFHVFGQDERGNTALRRVYTRRSLMQFVANTPVCLIGIEACSGSNYWVREFKRHGHTVKMLPPQYVKPFVKTNKNDFNDAEAICEAVQRPNMHFVSEKSREQQDIQVLHRVRRRLISNHTALSNEIRGFLFEFGIVTGTGKHNLKKIIDEVLSMNDERLSTLVKKAIEELKSEWIAMEVRIENVTKEIERVFNSDETCKRLSKIPGVGVMTATAIKASAGNPSDYKSGRQFAAWLGLVPRQSSSGGKTVLLGISKRGDNYCRQLLVHGGRSLVIYADRKTDARNKWISEKAKTRGKNKAAVAVANKNARIIWKMLSTGEEYRVAI